MKTLVIYDISEDDVRLRVMEVCKNFGLSHIQKSAFLGPLSSSRRKELIASLRKALGEARGNIQVFVLCRYCYGFRVVIGEEYKPLPVGVVVV